MIKLNEVTKKYMKKVALRDVNLERQCNCGRN